MYCPDHFNFRARLTNAQKSFQGFGSNPIWEKADQSVILMTWVLSVHTDLKGADAWHCRAPGQ